jgi:hypothetical protein
MADTSFGIRVQGRVEPTPGWVRGLLIVVTALESLGAVRDFPVLFAAPEQFFEQGLGGWIIAAKLVISPVVALAAFVFAGLGRTRQAVLALAGVIFLTWLNYMPSVVLHGFDFSGSLPVALQGAFQIVLVPLLVAVIAVLAWQQRQLTLAAVLASLPTVVGVIGVVAFAIGVSIYGF